MQTVEHKQDIDVMDYEPLVRMVSGRIASKLPSFADKEDLYSCGFLGLMNACELFDVSRGCTFKTYAEHRIRGAIMDELRARDWVPRSVRKLDKRLHAARINVEQRLGSVGDEGDVADVLGMNAMEYSSFLIKTQKHPTLSLDSSAPTSEASDKNSLGDIIEDTNAVGGLEALELAEMQSTLEDLIEALPDKEQAMLILYYKQDLNMKEIGKLWGLTESRVCQIHTKAIARLRKRLQAL